MCEFLRDVGPLILFLLFITGMTLLACSTCSITQTTQSATVTELIFLPGTSGGGAVFGMDGSIGIASGDTSPAYAVVFQLNEIKEKVVCDSQVLAKKCYLRYNLGDQVILHFKVTNDAYTGEQMSKYLINVTDYKCEQE